MHHEDYYSQHRIFHKMNLGQFKTCMATPVVLNINSVLHGWTYFDVFLMMLFHLIYMYMYLSNARGAFCG